MNEIHYRIITTQPSAVLLFCQFRCPRENENYELRKDRIGQAHKEQDLPRGKSLSTNAIKKQMKAY